MPIQPLSALREGQLAGETQVTLREGLTEFPPELFGLADTLEVLDLSGNALSDLPADMGRFKRLRVLFCSANRFQRLPPSLGDCTALSQVGFRGNGLVELPAEALPPAIRWLTLTDNAIETLPEALGQRPALQKLMLAGNRLTALPDSLANAERLELIRLSANRLDALPAWLTDLPRLAWLAWAGNPFDHGAAADVAVVDWSALRIEALLGEGASGQVHQARWADRPVALKLFKGAMTSDGLPEREMAAGLAAGDHPNLTGALGRLAGHPAGAEGLLMSLLPDHWRVLAGPPSPESCSRDVYDPALRLGLDVAVRIARDIGTGAAHLHARGINHGDLYAHNTLWDGDTGQAVLSDFGAASFIPEGRGGAFERLEVLAWGHLLGELLDRCEGEAPEPLRALQQACAAPDPSARPRLADTLALLDDSL
jgi:hypothetical protein